MRLLGLSLTCCLALVLASCGLVVVETPLPAQTLAPLPAPTSTILPTAARQGQSSAGHRDGLPAPISTVLPTAAPQKPDVILTIGAPTGARINHLLGVNIGPAPAGKDPNNADLTSAYRQIGVTLIRTHDFYGPLDMAVMYPDRTRNPTNQLSYDFRISDAMWRAIVNGGFEPYLRLGDSYNNATPPANAHERANWVNAAVEVVRHYRQGQWNGFSTRFRYVEIWNEPDNQKFWPRPHNALEYYQLYVETARALKRAFPDLLIGGPGVTQMGAFTSQGKEWVHNFLKYVKQSNAPLDFFSWHLYSNDPDEWNSAAKFYRQELDSLGFQATQMHVTEWNTDTRKVGDQSAEAFALRVGGKGAAILTAAWIAMQENGVAEAAFYRGPDPAMDAPTFYGMFFANGQPKRVALAFSLWAKMAAHPQRLAVSSTPAGALRLLAGQDRAGEIALLIANPTDMPVRYTISGAGVHRLALSQVSDTSEQVQLLTVTGNVIEVGSNTVQMVVIAK